MNRLHHLSFLHEAASDERYEIDQALLTADCGESAGHTIFAPLHYEPNYAYPLLVWLHGPAGDESQLMRIMPSISLRNYAGVAVRGTQEIQGSGGKRGYAWLQQRSHVALAEQSVFEAIEHVRQRINVAPRRIFIGHTTSLARLTIFMNRRSRSSRATAPKMREPRGLPSGSTSTTALLSNRT